MRLQEHPHYLLLVWLIVSGLIVFGVTVSWGEGLVAMLVDGDRSRISLIIGLLYVIGTIHCASRVVFLSGELNQAAVIAGQIAAERGRASVRCVMTNYLVDLMNAHHETLDNETPTEKSNLTEALAERLKGAHEMGWFVVDILLKLGLVGTIIGFILMLGSVANTASLDVNTMQKVLRQMSSGMGTALFTTLAGLIGSILLGLQYLLLDKGSDELIHRVIRVAEIDVKPSLKAAGNR